MGFKTKKTSKNENFCYNNKNKLSIRISIAMQKVNDLIKARYDKKIQGIELTFEEELVFVNQVADEMNLYQIEDQLYFIQKQGASFYTQLSTKMYQTLIHDYYENKNDSHLNKDILEYILYTKKASWQRHEPIISYLTSYPNLNMKKAGLVIELLSIYEKKNFSLSTIENQEKLNSNYDFLSQLLEQWKNQDNQNQIFNSHLGFYLLKNLKVINKQKQLHQFIFNYIAPFSQDMALYYPDFIHEFKKSTILKSLLKMGYSKMYQKNPQLVEQTIISFVEENFLEQAQVFIDYFGLELKTLEKVKEIMKNKQRSWFSDSNKKRMNSFENQLEVSYLNKKVSNDFTQVIKNKIKI